MKSANGKEIVRKIEIVTANKYIKALRQVILIQNVKRIVSKMVFDGTDKGIMLALIIK